MKIKRKKLYSTLTALKDLPVSNSVKASYALAKNRRVILAIIEPLDESKNPSEEYIKFDTERGELCEKHAKKTDKGAAMIVDGAYVFTDESRIEFDAALLELRAKYKDAVEEYEKKIKEFNELLNGEEEVKYHTIPLSEIEKAFPSIKQSLMDEIYDMIREGE